MEDQQQIYKTINNHQKKHHQEQLQYQSSIKDKNKNSIQNISNKNLNQTTIQALLKIFNVPLPTSKTHTNNNKLQSLFQFVYDTNPQILQTLLPYLLQHFVNGNIQLRDKKYAQYFSKYIFLSIREVYPDEQKYLKQTKVDKDMDDTKTPEILKADPKQSAKRGMQFNINLLNIIKLLQKQKYQYQKIDGYIEEQVFTLNKTPTEQHNQTFSLWKLVEHIPSYCITECNIHQNIIILQYYDHLLSKVLDNIISNGQNSEYIDLLIDGWFYQHSRQYITREITNKFQQTTITTQSNKISIISSQQQKIFKLLYILDQYIQKQHKKQPNSNLINNLLYIQQYYIITPNHNKNSTQYPKYKISTDVMNNKLYQPNNNNTTKQIDHKFLNQLSPSDIIYLSQYFHQQKIQINTQPPSSNSISNDIINSNIRYFYYLYNSSNNQQNIYMQQYITNQLQIITQQLINNSYPTTTIICDSYKSLTNCLYELNKCNEKNNAIKFGQKIKYVLTCVWKQISKVLWQQENTQQEQQYNYKNNQYILATLANKQRLSILLVYMNDNNIDININQQIKIKTNTNNDFNFYQLYYKIKISNIIYSFHINIQLNFDDILNTIKQIQRIVYNKQNSSYTEVFVLQLLQYCINITQHDKQKQSLSQNKMNSNKQNSYLLYLSLTKIQNILYGNENSHYIYTNAIIYSHRVVSIIIKGYLLLTAHKDKLDKYISSQGINQQMIRYIMKIFDKLQKQQKVISYIQTYTKLNTSGKQKKNMEDHGCQNKFNNKFIIFDMVKRNFTVAQMSMFLGLIIAQTNISINIKRQTHLECQKHPIYQQLITQKSSILQQCLKLLFPPQSQLISQHIVPLSHPPFIHNLRQYNNIAIKFNELIQHNNHRQLVCNSDFYRNHWSMYIYLQCLQIYMINIKSSNSNNNQQIYDKISQHIKDKLTIIKNAQSTTIHNSGQFYTLLQYWQYIYVMVYYQPILLSLTGCQANFVSHHSIKKQYDIVEQLLQILGKGSINPLIRQYISVILSKIYNWASKIRQQKSKNIVNIQSINGNISDKLLAKRMKWRSLLIQKLSTDNKKDNNININITVPVLFTLGYQMIRTMKTNMQIINKCQQHQSQQIFYIFIKFISCHHAYIRAIAQYYIMKAVQLKVIHTNSNIIQDTKNTPHNYQNNNNKFLQHLCLRQWKQDKDCMKMLKNISIAVEGFNQVMTSQQAVEFLSYERVEQCPTQNVIRQMRYDLNFLLDRVYKRNEQYIKRKNFTSEHNSSLLQKNILKKIAQIQELNSKYISPRLPLVLHYKHPDIIIIATLLEKVHNFGYILRTLHQKQAMLLVPSHLPLLHPQCQQFIPQNSQIQVIQIKNNQLEYFIKLQKKLGYPLIALQQCAGSIKIQQYEFPKKYMLLLGNQRIGAPASLLNQADALVQIPQVGKVRSLNVHVSMVVCLWQSIINAKNQ